VSVPSGEVPGAFSASEAEQVIRLAWEEILQVDGIASDNDFFELGGHSLSASQVISRIQRDLGIVVTLTDFFEMPTIAELAEFAAGSGSGGAVVPTEGAKGA
jgi:acyl carrier protein